MAFRFVTVVCLVAGTFFLGCDSRGQFQSSAPSDGPPLSKLTCNRPASETVPVQDIDPDEIVDIMQRVRQFHTRHILVYTPRDRYNKWIDCAMYTGLTAAYRATGDDVYLDSTQAWAERVDWQLGPRETHADDHCVGQVYLEMHQERPDVADIEPTLTGMQEVIDRGGTGAQIWDWVDALYMAPPVFSRMAALTGSSRPMDFMASRFQQASVPLYDVSYGLYYRDLRFIDAESPNGEKVFWSRGNGWVFAGIARVLQDLPQDHPSRPWFENRFQEMAEAVACTQQTSGFWRPSMLDAAAYPQPETSGTGFFTYALAWGINQGLLSLDTYGPVVSRAWMGMVREAVNEDGRVGWVQQPGDRPASVEPDHAEPYGAGAFLLAGSQMKVLVESQ